MAFITLNLQYIDVQGDSMYSNLSIHATCFFNITLRLHIPGIMSNFIGRATASNSSAPKQFQKIVL